MWRRQTGWRGSFTVGLNVRIDKKCDLHISSWWEGPSISATATLIGFSKLLCPQVLRDCRKNNTSNQLLSSGRLVDERYQKIKTLNSRRLKNADSSAQQRCVFVGVSAWSAVVMETKSSSPVISNISVRSYHPEHLLSVPLSVPDQQLDGHTASRGWSRRWAEADRTRISVWGVHRFLWIQ